MACECAANCKSDVLAKQSRYLALINSLNASGVTADLSQIYTYILNDINRLRGIQSRMEEMQSIVMAESALPAEGYMPSSVEFGCLQELIKINAVSPTEYATLSAILGVSIPVVVVPEVPGGE